MGLNYYQWHFLASMILIHLKMYTKLIFLICSEIYVGGPVENQLQQAPGILTEESEIQIKKKKKTVLMAGVNEV